MLNLIFGSVRSSICSLCSISAICLLSLSLELTEHKILSLVISMFLQPHENILVAGSVLAQVHCDTARGERGTKYL